MQVTLFQSFLLYGIRVRARIYRENPKTVLWIQMIFFGSRSDFSRLFRIQIRILHEMCESDSASRALRGKLALTPAFTTRYALL
jgi:hypothetical protein